jgi:hypothetical protein
MVAAISGGILGIARFRKQPGSKNSQRLHCSLFTFHFSLFTFHFSPASEGKPIHSFPRSRQVIPAHDKLLSGGRAPVGFQRGVTFGAEAAPLVMAEAAFERHEAAAVKFAESVPEEIAAFVLEGVCRIRAFATIECRR